MSEGGYSSNPKEPGTGPAVRWAREASWHAKGHRRRVLSDRDIRNLTDAEFQSIYRQDFWNPVRGNDLVRGLDLTVSITA